MRDFETVTKTVEGNEGDKCNYRTRLDTYGCGCQHDCKYCYAKSLLDFRGLWNAENPSVGDIHRIATRIRKLPREIVRMGGMTDCFQPCKASPPSERVKAILKLQEGGYDVALRLSPFLPEYMDIDKLNSLGIDKVCIEFLRANSWIKKWFDVDYSKYTVKHGGYNHLPLEEKIKLVSLLTGFKQMTVCEDEDRAYAYWRDNFNANPDDCCNLRTHNEAKS